MKAKHREICEKYDWSVYVSDDGTVELEKYSPAGEDFFFSVASDDFVQEVKEYAAGFDIDEHIAMWIEAKQNGTRGGSGGKFVRRQDLRRSKSAIRHKLFG